MLRLLVNNFEWIKGTSQFNEDFIKERSDDGYFLEVDVQYLERLHKPHNDSPFLPERIKIQKVKRFVANLYDKSECDTHTKIKTGIKSWINFLKSS